MTITTIIGVFILISSNSTGVDLSIRKYKIEEYENIKLSEKMVLVKGGTFKMGAKTWFLDERPIHKVTVDDFYISKTEVTQEEWISVMGNNPSQYENDKYPVEMVSWFDAVGFCNKLSKKEGLEPCYLIQGDTVKCDFTKNGYRLPTEAEWEFAAKGGNKSKGFKYSGSNNVDEIAQYTGNNELDCNSEVASLKANELGIFDMSGSVYEWCWDQATKYTKEHAINPTGNKTGKKRRVRGGSSFCSRYFQRITYRNTYKPDSKERYIGFRVARSGLNNN